MVMVRLPNKKVPVETFPFYFCGEMQATDACDVNTKTKLDMEKELFLTTLKSKAGVDNLSERTIDEVATVFLPQFADDAKITDELWALPVQTLKSMSGQLRHDLSGEITTFKSKYETEQKAANQKAIDDAVAAAKAEWEKAKATPPAQESNNIDDAVAAAVAKALEGVTGENGSIGKLTKQLTDYITKAEQEKLDAAIGKFRDGLKTYLVDERGANREPVVNLAIKGIEVKADSDFDKLKIEVEKAYEKLYKEFYGDGASPYAGGGGGGSDSSTGRIEEWAKGAQKRAEEESAAATALEKHIFK